MPFPRPKDDEKKDQFVDRCVADDSVSGEFEDDQQRLSICRTIYDSEGQRKDNEQEKKSDDSNPDEEKSDEEESDEKEGNNEEDRSYDEIRMHEFGTNMIEHRQEDGQDILSGYVVQFDRMSLPIGGMFREKVERGAFTKTLQRTKTIAVWNHNIDLVLGNTRNRTLKLYEDDIGLRFEIKPPNTQAGRDAIELIKKKYVTGVSMGMNVVRDNWEEGGELPIRTLYEVDLIEISPTPLPAYPDSGVQTNKRNHYDGSQVAVRALFKLSKGLSLKDDEKRALLHAKESASSGEVDYSEYEMKLLEME
ncbi:HK97 family phage prohead protease [Paenalkalicoccus suaedae]|uniref:HK97 family phage prohead protease n=1 Tax=Paenalkalicoccus suaedae TaxID=2592382 RepID=A0A859FGX3_9BACI|nr:HK97 family phage prohead protease [Paenalkalicoccus suaedae]QKS71912.1 HK97 family phage prohead protease [Paenalkalicoccus suaedae]